MKQQRTVGLRLKRRLCGRQQLGMWVRQKCREGVHHREGWVEGAAKLMLELLLRLLLLMLLLRLLV